MFKQQLPVLLAAGIVVGFTGCASVAARQSRTAQSNTQVVLAFEDTVFNKHQVQEGFDRFVGATYRQHNPRVPDGRDGAVSALGLLIGLSPDTRVVVKRTVAQGDLVAVHLHAISSAGEAGAAGGMSIVDIFRLENGKIVEHWDVLQQVPESAANGNTMF